MPRPSTVQFIAMLRALDRAVASHGVSHAEVERRLCDWMAQGRRAEEELGRRPAREDRDGLRELADRKNAVEQSGLARLDGRKDRAGGQRIGELVTGRFPAGTTPPRRRVDVCVDVFLTVLEENDPAGYAEGMYGTRQSWRQWWLQADQGHPPKIDDRSLTVWGYLDAALEQLTGTTALGTGDQHHVPAARGPGNGSAELIDQIKAEKAEAEQRVAEAHGERDRALERARKAQETLDRVRDETERRVADAQAGRDQVLERARRAERRVREVSIALAIAVVAAAGAAVPLLLGAGSPVRTVQLASPAIQVTAADRPKFTFAPLPSGEDWTLHVRLTVIPTDRVSACTYGMRVTAHAEADGQALASFTSRSGQTTITQQIHLGKRGSRGLQLIVTRLDTDPPCKLRLDPAGSRATATG